MENFVDLVPSELHEQLRGVFADDTFICRCLEGLRVLLLGATGVTAGHDVEHSVRVLLHANAAALVQKPSLSAQELRTVRVAAALHDADDTKVFKVSTPVPSDAPLSLKYPRATAIIRIAYSDTPFSSSSFLSIPPSDSTPQNDDCDDAQLKSLVSTALSIISVVSTSANGNAVPEGIPPWHLIVRHADRLEALGLVGLQRCYDYTIATGRPLALPITLRATSLDDLKQRVAPAARFAAYCGSGPSHVSWGSGSGKSLSMVDHVYDKLLHIGDPDCFPSADDNSYLNAEAAVRHGVIVNFALAFGEGGMVDPSSFDRPGEVVCVSSS